MTGFDSHRLIVAALALIHSDEGVLLVQQNIGAGLWGIPGGHIEAGETVERAALREVREETGLIVTLGPVVGFYTVPTEEAVSVLFAATVVGGALQRVTAETADCRFFAPDPLPAAFRPHHRQRVLDFLSGGTLPVFRVQ